MATVRMTRYCGTLQSTGIFFAGLIGVALLIFSGHTIYRNWIARQWPLTEGCITSARTFLQDASTGKPGNAKVARAEVRFSYAVDGKQYQSSNVSYHRGIGGTNQVYDPSYAVTYPAGSLVKVAYNPLQPSESVIDTSQDPYIRFSAGVILLLMFFGYQIWLRSGSVVGPAT